MNSVPLANSKKILIVSYTFYPDSNPRSLRWQALSAQFIARGFEVHVLTQNKAEKNGLIIFGRKKLPSKNINENKPIEKTNREILKSSNLIQILKKRIRKLFKIIIWPDFSAAWLPWAIYKLFVLGAQNNYERIISSSHPMSGHLPVLFLKKIGCLKSSYWIVDIGDPFGLISFHNLNNQFLYKRLNFNFEKSVCMTADLICVTTKQTRNLYLDGYGLQPEKVVIAPPVLSLDINSIEDVPSPYSNAINLIFAGTLYKEIRNPKIVLDFADFLEKTNPGKFNFHFFGVLGDCATYFRTPGANVFTYGLVDRDYLKPFFVHADAVINIGNTSKFQLPSKIIEAIATKKFIFNFCLDAEDTSSDFLEAYPGFINIYGDSDFTNAIAGFEVARLNKTQIDAASKAIIVNHSPRTISDLFLRN